MIPTVWRSKGPVYDANILDNSINVMHSIKSPITAINTININMEISIMFFLRINKYAGYTQATVKKII